MWPSVWATLLDYWCSFLLMQTACHLSLSWSLAIWPVCQFSIFSYHSHPGTYYKLPSTFPSRPSSQPLNLPHEVSYFSIPISANGLNNTWWEQKRISLFKRCQSTFNKFPINSDCVCFQGFSEQDCWHSLPWGCFVTCNVLPDPFCCLKAACSLASYI